MEATITSVPVAISDEAAARITELGLSLEFERIVERLKQTIPGLWKLTVDLRHDFEEPVPPTILIDTYRPFLGLDREDSIHEQWTRWLIQAFPAAVFAHFVMLPTFEEANGR